MEDYGEIIIQVKATEEDIENKESELYTAFDQLLEALETWLSDHGNEYPLFSFWISE